MCLNDIRDALNHYKIGIAVIQIATFSIVQEEKCDKKIVIFFHCDKKDKLCEVV